MIRPTSTTESEQQTPLMHTAQEAEYEQAIHQRIVSKEMPGSEPTRGMFALHDQLRAKFGESSVCLGESQLARHGTDLSMAVPYPTGLVFYPEDASQIAWLLEYLPDGMAVVPYGKGTSTEGQTIPTGKKETISIDMHKMRRILDYNRQDMRITVEAGLDLHALNQVLAEDGLWFPVDPMTNATVGGMAAEDAEGISVHRYGRMSSNVIQLRVVLADGHVTILDEHSPLMRLFVGSEGSLGVITELTLRLVPLKKRFKTVFLCYSRLEEAALAVPEILRDQEGMIACFLLDCGAVREMKDVSRMAECPTILLQLGYEAPLNMSLTNVTIDVQEWSEVDLQKTLWSSLSHVWLTGTPTTVTVPPSKLAEIVREHHPDGMEPSTGSLFANCPTGTLTIVKPEEQVEALREELFGAVKRMKGSVGGYGTGMKREWVEDMGLWNKIKQALDPRSILNPS